MMGDQVPREKPDRPLTPLNVYSETVTVCHTDPKNGCYMKSLIYY